MNSVRNKLHLDISNRYVKAGDYFVYADLVYWNNLTLLKYGKIVSMVPDSSVINAILCGKGFVSDKWRVRKNGTPLPIGPINSLLKITRKHLPKEVKVLLDKAFDKINEE